MAAFVWPYKKGKPCTICGQMVSKGQVFVFESQEDVQSTRPTHRLCSYDRAGTVKEATDGQA